MLKVVFPDSLKAEFATIDALWRSNAETRRVDSLLLAWVKYEKQLRRLFCFLVYQHPRINSKHIDSLITVLAKNRKLYPETFTKAIGRLGVKSVPMLVGPEYRNLSAELQRIQRVRNKLMHGQITGLKIKSIQLERDVRSIVEWVSLLAAGAQTELGYDGLGRNTFKQAKSVVQQSVAKYPFSTVKEFGVWLRGISGP